MENEIKPRDVVILKSDHKLKMVVEEITASNRAVCGILNLRHTR